MTKEKDALEEGQADGHGGALIAGFLDVKLPGRTRRRRFGPWKSWRRHWVQARLMPDALRDADAPVEAVELVLSPARLSPETGVIRVPAGPGSRASVCRTASRSRCHAFVIAAPALAALGPDQGEVFLATRSDADTERWMAVLRAAIAGREPLPTSPMQRGLSAASAALLRGRRLSRSEGDLLAAPLGPLGIGLAPSPEDALDSPSLCAGLRVPSPAELRSRGAAAQGASDTPSKTSTLPRPRPSNGQAAQAKQPFRLLYGRRRAETLNAQTCPDKDRLSTSPSQSHSGSALSLFGGKIASGLLSAGLGLILSTPGGSEAEDNDAEDNDAEDNDDDVDDDADVLPTDLPDLASRAALDRRRESAVSVASGIYEEIADCGAGSAAHAAEAVYENAAVALSRRASNGHENHYEDPVLLLTPRRGDADGLPGAWRDGRAAPPPLPPRQNLTPISELLTRSRVPADGGVDADGYVQMGLVRSLVKSAASAAKAKPSFELLCAAKCTASPLAPLGHLASDAEPTYLPMSPVRPPGFEKNRGD